MSRIHASVGGLNSAPYQSLELTAKGPLSVLVPSSGPLYSRVCNDRAKPKLLEWFRSVHELAVNRVKETFPRLKIVKVFLVMGQTLTKQYAATYQPEHGNCELRVQRHWTAPDSTSSGLNDPNTTSTTSVRTAIPPGELKLSTVNFKTRTPTFGYFVDEATAYDGFEIVTDRAMYSIFLEVYEIPSEKGYGLQTIFSKLGFGPKRHTAGITERQNIPPPNAKLTAPPQTGVQYGLRVLKEPTANSSNSPLIDIVFVHGLGGSSIGTWKHPKSGWVWPPELVREKHFRNLRISSFGYNANWENVLGTRNVLDIAGFATQLLDSLDAHYDKRGDVGNNKK